MSVDLPIGWSQTVSSNAKVIQSIITADQLIQRFKALGLEAGDVVEVHASMRALGFVLGSAHAVLEAFLDVLTPTGTLVMSAQAWDNSEPAHFTRPPLEVGLYAQFRAQHPPFQGRFENLSNMGALAMAMQKHPDVRFSTHPQVAFMALGQHAEAIVANHPLADMFSAQSPLGKLYELDAKIVLIGVDYDACTAMHLAEHLSGVRPYQVQGSRVLVNGHAEWQSFLSYRYDSDDFKAIGAAMEMNQLVQTHRLGSTKVKVMRMRAITDFTQRYFEEL
jgi:aminoglycoside 3-N-acetyltransferase